MCIWSNIVLYQLYIERDKVIEIKKKSYIFIVECEEDV